MTPNNSERTAVVQVLATNLMSEDDATLMSQLQMIHKAFLFYNGSFGDILEVWPCIRDEENGRITLASHDRSNTRGSRGGNSSKSSRR